MAQYPNLYALGDGEQGTRKTRPNGAPALLTDGDPSLVELFRASFPGRALRIIFDGTHACAAFPDPSLDDDEQTQLAADYAAWTPTDPEIPA